MEDIAVTNDLACSSIEMGHYRTALEVLNRCLACVKKLKNCRHSIQGDQKHSYAYRYKIEESISLILKETQRKLLPSTESSTTSIADSAKRKSTRTHSCSQSNYSLPRKRRRGEQGSNFVLDHNSHSENNNKNTRDDSESRTPFIYRKPTRLTEPQWDRIRQYQVLIRATKNTEGKPEIQKLEREIELTISSNLLFNIALSHHMMAVASSSSTQKEEAWLTDSDDSNSEDESDDDSSNGYDEPCSSCSQSEQHLGGALRLYEVGFWIYSKRIAIVASQSPESAFLPLFLPSSPVELEETNFSEQQEQQQPRSVLRSHGNASGCISNSTSFEAQNANRYALAMINNCAHIHECLGNFDRASAYRNRLLSLLMVIIDSGQSVRDVVGDDGILCGYLSVAFKTGVFPKEKILAAAA